MPDTQGVAGSIPTSGTFLAAYIESYRCFRSNNSGIQSPVCSLLEKNGTRMALMKVSLNVDGGVSLVKSANCTCYHKTQHTEPDMVSYTGTVASLKEHGWISKKQQHFISI